MTDDTLFGETNEPAMSAETDALVRAAFDQLRSDAASPDVEAALAAMPRGEAAFNHRVVSGPRTIAPWLVAAAVTAIALLGGLAVWSRDDATTVTTDETAMTPDGLGRWALAHGEVDGRVFFAAEEPGLISFDIDSGLFVGEAFCTPYGGALTSDRMSPIASEPDACESDDRAQRSMKADYFAALGRVTRLDEQGTQLRLTGPDVLLEFERRAGEAIHERLLLPRPSPTPLASTPQRWLLTRGTSADGTVFLASPATAEITLSILDGGRTAFGDIGCVSYLAGIDDERFTRTDPTDQSCTAAERSDIASIETAYLQALAAVESIVIDDDRLTLSGGGVLLEFQAPGEVAAVAPTESGDDVARELTANKWRQQFIVDGSKRPPAPAQDGIEMFFADDGSMGWSNSCHSATGQWSATDGAIKFGDFDDVAANVDNPTCGEEARRLVELFVASDSRLVDGTLRVEGPDQTLIFYRSLAEPPCQGLQGSGRRDASEGTESTATAVAGIAVHRPAESPDCVRTVITLQRSDAAGSPIILADDVDVVYVDGGGVEIRFSPPGNDVVADFPPPNGRVLGDGSVAVLASDADGAYIYVNHGAGSTTFAVWEQPAQIILETTLEPNGSRPVGGAGILPKALNADGGVTMPLTVAGYGTGFEGAQSLALFDASGEPAVAEWTGVFGGEQTGATVGVPTGNFVYGRFSFTIDGLAPGDYELRWLGAVGPPEGPEFLQVEPFTVLGL